MKTPCLLVIAFLVFVLSSCKKEPTPIKEDPKTEIPDQEDSPTISYKKINQKLKAADVNPMNLDVNGDGLVDCSYFMQHVFLSGKVHLYAGVNPVFGSANSANAHNENEYLNMGAVHTFSSTNPIYKDLSWTEDHSLLTDRIEEPDGGKNYTGNWANGQAQMMSIRIPIQGKMHYAWAQLKFDKANEELILIDAAWNTIPEQEIKAGAK